MRTHLALITALALPTLARAQAPEPPAKECTKVLPVADAEKLSGVKPLELVGRNQVKFAGGNCNYVGPGKKLVLLLTLDLSAGKDGLQPYRSQAKYAGGEKPLPGVGDEGFSASGLAAFRKGNAVVSIGSFMDMSTGKPILSDAKIAEVAKAIATKL